MKITFLMPQIETSPYCWLVELGTGKLGVHKQRGWCMQFDSADTVFFENEEYCVPLVPVLNVDEEKFFEFLEMAAIANNQYADAIHCFPKEMLLKHVFHTSFSGYWPEKALSWLSADERLQSLFHDELEKVVANKVMPQGMRQKAKKIVKSLVAQSAMNNK